MIYEYPAMIYKSHRNNVFVANCIIKNIIGFGKTEEDAISNLEESLKSQTKEDIVVTPMYGFSMVQSL